MAAPMIYHAHPGTGEYLGTGVADPDPLDPSNWLVPGFAYRDAPPKVPANHVARRTGDKTAWELVEDYRGTIYSTATGEAQVYDRLGPLPVGWVTAPRPGPYYTWSGAAWVIDKPSQLLGARQEAIARRDELLAVATLRMSPLQDAVDLGRATKDEKAQLVAWKGYRIDLSRIEQQDGFPLEVAWPTSPAEAANPGT